MPLFEFQCQDCGWVFEVFTKRQNQKVKPKCPECEKTDVERVWSRFSGRAGEGGGCATSSFGLG